MKKVSTVLWGLVLATSITACGDKDAAANLRGQRLVVEKWDCESVAQSWTTNPSVRYYATFNETEVVTSVANQGQNPVDQYRDAIQYRSSSVVALPNLALTMQVTDQGNAYVLRSQEVGAAAGCNSNPQDHAIIVLLKTDTTAQYNNGTNYNNGYNNSNNGLPQGYRTY
jgi:hypothetical protein